MIDKFEHEGNLRRIFAAILVDKSSQRPILIGAGGEVLKRIGTEARLDIQKLFGGPVYPWSFCQDQEWLVGERGGAARSGILAARRRDRRRTNDDQRATISVAAKLAQRLLPVRTAMGFHADAAPLVIVFRRSSCQAQSA